MYVQLIHPTQPIYIYIYIYIWLKKLHYIVDYSLVYDCYVYNTYTIVEFTRALNLLGRQGVPKRFSHCFTKVADLMRPQGPF